MSLMTAGLQFKGKFPDQTAMSVDMVLLDPLSSVIEGYYDDWLMEVTSGVHRGSFKKVTSYDWISKTAFVTPEWENGVLPSYDDSYLLFEVKDDFYNLLPEAFRNLDTEGHSQGLSQLIWVALSRILAKIEDVADVSNFKERNLGYLKELAKNFNLGDVASLLDEDDLKSILNNIYVLNESKGTRSSITLLARKVLQLSNVQWIDNSKKIMKFYSHRKGEVVSGTVSGVVLNTGSSGMTSYYNGKSITITDPLGPEETKIIVGYNGITKLVTFDSDLTIGTPDVGWRYSIALDDAPISFDGTADLFYPYGDRYREASFTLQGVIDFSSGQTKSLNYSANIINNLEVLLRKFIPSFLQLYFEFLGYQDTEYYTSLGIYRQYSYLVGDETGSGLERALPIDILRGEAATYTETNYYSIDSAIDMGGIQFPINVDSTEFFDYVDELLATDSIVYNYRNVEPRVPIESLTDIVSYIIDNDYEFVSSPFMLNSTLLGNRLGNVNFRIKSEESHVSSLISSPISMLERFSYTGSSADDFLLGEGELGDGVLFGGSELLEYNSGSFSSRNIETRMPIKSLTEVISYVPDVEVLSWPVSVKSDTSSLTGTGRDTQDNLNYSTMSSPFMLGSSLMNRDLISRVSKLEDNTTFTVGVVNTEPVDSIKSDIDTATTDDIGVIPVSPYFLLNRTLLGDRLGNSNFRIQEEIESASTMVCTVFGERFYSVLPNTVDLGESLLGEDYLFGFSSLGETETIAMYCLFREDTYIGIDEIFVE